MKAAERHLRRALQRHLAGNHPLRIRLVEPNSLDLQLECVWCDLPLMAGSPAMINYIGEQLVEAGAKVVRPRSQPQVKLQ